MSPDGSTRERAVVPAPLTEAAWSPFGWLPVADVDPKDGNETLTFEWADAHVNLIGHARAEVPETPRGLRCDMLFRHDTHTQALMPLNVPAVALQVIPLVVPPLAVALKVIAPGATVCAAGDIGVMLTPDGVTKHVVDTTLPCASVTVSVYVFPDVSSGVGYEPPLTADAVMSELPTPIEPITAVPPENVGTRFTEEL